MSSYLISNLSRVKLNNPTAPNTGYHRVRWCPFLPLPILGAQIWTCRAGEKMDLLLSKLSIEHRLIVFDISGNKKYDASK
jgi:hypothetical protein